MTKFNTTPPFADLALSDLSARLAELREEVGRIDAAICAAQEQQQAIGRKRHELREVGRDGRAVADALLADPAAARGVAAMLAPDIDQLSAEFDALAAALRELRARRDSVSARIAELEADAFGLIGEAAQPLVSALELRAVEHINGLVQTFADLSALTYAARAGAYTTDRLRRAVGQLLGGADPLVAWRKTHPISQDMAAALDALAAQAPALPIAVNRTAFMP